MPCLISAPKAGRALWLEHFLKWGAKLVNEQIDELSQEIERFLRQKYKIMPSQAYLFSLRMCGMSFEEIAFEASMKPKSASSLVDRARKQMGFKTIYEAAYQIGRQIG